MYTLLCRLFHKFHHYPKRVLLISLLVTLVSLYFASKLKIKTSILDVLPENLASLEILKKVEAKFGGLGKLTVVITSPDSSLNRRAIEFLASYLKSHPDINFLDYKSELDFYEANKLLYISLSDLTRIRDYIHTNIKGAKAAHHPFLVDFETSADSLAASTHDTLNLQELRDKYLKKMGPYHGSQDETALVMHVFPKFDVADIKKCRSLEKEIKFSMHKFPEFERLKVYYTGEVMETLQEEGRLLKEVMGSGWVSLFTVVAVLLLFYFRIPLGPILALLPLSMGIVWTLGLAYLWVGHLTMVTLSLGIILLGLGLDAALHLLARFVEERQKGLSAEVAFETITLETGPAIATGALTSAAAFFSITVTEFKGFQEFGIIAGIGMICTLISILLIFPSLLIFLDKFHLIKVYGLRINYQSQFVRRPFLHWKWSLGGMIFLTLICLPLGLQTRFEYNFEKLQFPRFNAKADSIIAATGEALRSPTVVISPSQEETKKVTWSIHKYMETDTLSPTIHSVVSLNQMLPRHQSEKLKLIQEMKSLLTPEVTDKATGSLKESIELLQKSWDVGPVSPQELPESFRKKFVGKDSQTGNFTFIFPSIDLNNGLNCHAFAEDTREIWVDDSTVYHTSGIAVVYSDLLNLMRPDTLKALIIALCTVFLLVLLDTKSWRATAVVFCPLLIGIIWTLGVMKLGGIKINHFNLVVLPAMIGIGIDNSIHLYHRYLEEGLGSLYFVLRKTGSVVFITSLTSLAGFFGLALSSHRGLFSMGLTAMIGISATFLASLLFVPLFLGILDQKRIKRNTSL